MGGGGCGGEAASEFVAFGLDVIAGLLGGFESELDLDLFDDGVVVEEFVEGRSRGIAAVDLGLLLVFGDLAGFGGLPLLAAKAGLFDL